MPIPKPVGEGWTDKRKARISTAFQTMREKTDRRYLRLLFRKLGTIDCYLEEEMDGYAQYLRTTNAFLIKPSVIDNRKQYSSSDVAVKFLHELTHAGDLNTEPERRIWSEEKRTDAFRILFGKEPSYLAPYYGDDLKLPFYVVGSGSDENRTWVGGQVYYRRGAEIIAYMATRIFYGTPGRWYRGIAQLPGGHFTKEQNEKIRALMLDG